MRSRPRLVAVAWYRPGTGLTRALTGMLRGLGSAWEVDVAAVHHEGPVLDVHGTRIHPTSLEGDAYGTYKAVDLARQRRPDVVLCFNDVWFMERYARLLRPAAPQARLVAHVPLDGCFADPRWARDLLGFDLVVVYTSWAAREIERAWDAASIGTAGRPRLAVVPHAVDTEAFRPAAELVRSGYAASGRVGARRRVFPEMESPEEAFVVLNANRPDPRKRIDVTLGAFARFARGKPHGVRLCLQQSIGSADLDREVLSRAARLGIADRLILNPLPRAASVASDAALNDLYNACDVGVNTSMGEGWGLVSCEHAAAGAAQVVPRHSACAELWEGRGVVVPVSRRYVPRFSVLELAEVAPDAVAAALDDLYRRPARLAWLAAVGAGHVRRPELGWQAVGRRWSELLAARWDDRRRTDERIA